MRSQLGGREGEGTAEKKAGRAVRERTTVERRGTAVSELLLGGRYSWEEGTVGREKVGYCCWVVGGWRFRRPAPTNDLIYVYGNWSQLTWLLHINFNCRIFFLLFFRWRGNWLLKLLLASYQITLPVNKFTSGRIIGYYVGVKYLPQIKSGSVGDCWASSLTSTLSVLNLQGMSAITYWEVHTFVFV